MTSQAVHFGTSGWRGIMADDFTFAHLRRAAAAVADHVRAAKKEPALLVARDTRFFSDEFAADAAGVLRSRGCRVLLCREPLPTPAAAHAIVRLRLQGGVIITASHNSAAYNGLKFTGPDGGPAPRKVTDEIERRAARIGEIPAPRDVELDECPDVRGPYFEHLRKMVRFDALRKTRGTFVCDAMHGCGAGWLDRVLTDSHISFSAIRTERDVLFDGAAPDPYEENLTALTKAVIENKALAGLATDGDADRYGILDRDGAFISHNHIFALLFDYLLETRGAKLGASRSVATTHLIDAVARLHGVPVYETPVGIKHVGPLLRQDKIILGGEESAGLTIRGHVPDKDGILACLLVAEMIAVRQTSLAAQLRDLFRRVAREFWPVRVNLHLSEDAQARLLTRLRADYKEFGGRRVVNTDRTDGLKLIFDDGDWVLIRPSGTEPLVRIYTEAATPAAAQKLAREVRAWAEA